jgi:cell division protein FtsZ
MVFITAGIGGGTGTGAAPVIARAAREQNILTVGVVTKPFHFEGTRRMRIAEQGIERLQEHVDTLIIIPNQNLFRIATEKTTFAEAFSMADQVLHSGVRGITDLMVMPGLINLDFADVRTVMNEMGKAMMGTGEASGDKRAIEAAHNAINNPLLDDVSMKGAKGVLINITGGMDMTLYEVDEAANEIRNEVDPDANIIVGSTFDEALDGTIRVSVVATGIDAEEVTLSPSHRRGADNVTPVWRAREARPQRQAEPVVRRNTDAVAVNETPRPAAPVSSQPAARSDAPEPTPAQKLQARAAEYAQSLNGGAGPAPQAEAPAPLEAEAPAVEPERPAVVETRERLERELGTEPAPEREAAPEAAPRESANPIKRGLSLFGRKAKAPERTEPRRDPLSSRSAAPAEPARAPQPAPRPAAQPSGDLFGDVGDDGDLEIPAFLRRQAN